MLKLRARAGVVTPAAAQFLRPETSRPAPTPTIASPPAPPTNSRREHTRSLTTTRCRFDVGRLARRELYLATKRDLAARDWKYVRQYADARSDVVAQIMSRAMPD
jgi:hypothetical protein